MSEYKVFKELSELDLLKVKTECLHLLIAKIEKYKEDNANLLLEGAMKRVKKLTNEINILTDMLRDNL